MNRKTLSALIVNDHDLDCDKTKTPTLDDITIDKVGFISSDLEKFDVIVYSGKLGRKTLRMRI